MERGPQVWQPVPAEGKADQLKALGAHLASVGWSFDNKVGRAMSARNMGQLHQGMKALADLHNSTCDMGKDCPTKDLSMSSALDSGSQTGDAGSTGKNEGLEEYLASIQLERRSY